ncbi:MAG: MFS transporter [Thermodesulfovibrionales bacterium]|nr:MFS transporter [Thermodesulfovibrionales bacterium]
MDKKKLYILCACIFPLMVCSGIIYSMFSLYLYEIFRAGASANAYIADIISPDRRGWAMGVYQKTMSLGWVVGPAIGGFLFETIGFQMTFLL